MGTAVTLEPMPGTYLFGLVDYYKIAMAALLKLIVLIPARHRSKLKVQRNQSTS
jgi:hypothetical protein